MRLPRVRFTLRWMMIIVVAIALALTSLRFASESVAGVLFLATLCSLSMGLIGVVYRRQRQRAFCLGAVLWGWGYMALAADFWWDITDHHPDTQPTHSSSPFGPGTAYAAVSPQRRPVLVTTGLLDRLRPSIQVVPDSGSPDFLGILSGKSRLSRKVLAKLETRVPMPFAVWTPFGDVLKHIKEATADEDFPAGIPIYVEPNGLAEAQKTLESPVTLDLVGIPLATSLKLLVDQMGLTYQVRDGIVTITAPALSARDTDSLILSFRRVGHCYFALLAAFLGGMVGRLIAASSPTRRMSE